jgi:hypothetical protein
VGVLLDPRTRSEAERQGGADICYFAARGRLAWVGARLAPAHWQLGHGTPAAAQVQPRLLPPMSLGRSGCSSQVQPVLPHAFQVCGSSAWAHVKRG